LSGGQPVVDCPVPAGIPVSFPLAIGKPGTINAALRYAGESR
jgi:hypothetical protein